MCYTLNQTQVMGSKVDTYEIITNQILSKLKQGVIPWKRVWNPNRIPENPITNRKYRGLNSLILSFEGRDCPFYATYKQIVSKGGTVKKGTKGIPLMYWNMHVPKEYKNKGLTEEQLKQHQIPFLKYFTVFNLEDTEGIEIPDYSNKAIDFQPIEKCESVVKEWEGCPEIKHSGDKAFYRPIEDIVYMPNQDTFKSKELYYSTLFHELAHSTGHKARLNRDLSHKFGSKEYAKEELIAELASAFICSDLGIDNSNTNDINMLDNTTAYIQSWIQVLSDDNKMLIQASSKARKAADMILSVKNEKNNG